MPGHPGQRGRRPVTGQQGQIRPADPDPAHLDDDLAGTRQWLRPVVHHAQRPWELFQDNGSHYVSLRVGVAGVWGGLQIPDQGM